MRRFGIRYFFIALLLLSFAVARAQTANTPPDFKEVYDLIRANVPGMTDEELNRAAVQGLVGALSPKVSLLTNGAPTSADGDPLSQAKVFDESIAYLRVARFNDGLAKAISGTFWSLNATNKLNGLVLDLRYTSGEDYAAAVAAANEFLGSARPLLNWGEGMVSSRQKENPIPVPVAILVNRATAGSPEALAAMLRQTGAGLIIGTRTAGQATIAKEFSLKSGDRLRLATTSVTLGDGSQVSTEGIKPDIDVTISLEDERAYYADAFWAVPRTNLVAGAGATNGVSRRRYNEAELVREHRESLDRQTNAPTLRSRPSEPEKPLISDPVLARALDLLKGLAVVRQARS